MIWGIVWRNDKENPVLRGEVTSYHRRDLRHEWKSLGTDGAKVKAGLHWKFDFRRIAAVAFLGQWGHEN